MGNLVPSLENSRNLQLLEGSISFFPSLIADIDKAQKSVQLETYIFDPTASGAHVAQALENAAKRGVKVQVMIEGMEHLGCQPNGTKASKLPACKYCSMSLSLL